MASNKDFHYPNCGMRDSELLATTGCACLARAHAEVERLREALREIDDPERDIAKAEVERLEHDLGEVKATLARFQADNERLREALERAHRYNRERPYASLRDLQAVMVAQADLRGENWRLREAGQELHEAAGPFAVRPTPCIPDDEWKRLDHAQRAMHAALHPPEEHTSAWIASRAESYPPAKLPFEGEN